VVLDGHAERRLLRERQPGEGCSPVDASKRISCLATSATCWRSWILEFRRIRRQQRQQVKRHLEPVEISFSTLRLGCRLPDSITTSGLPRR